MEMQKLTRPEIKMIGVAMRTTNRLEADPATARIPRFWQHYFEEEVEEQIPNKVDSSKRYVIYTNYESDYTGEYTYIIASEVRCLTCVPAGMLGLTLPATEYLIFPVEGHMPEALVTAWHLIWEHFPDESDVKRSYTADLEEYNKNCPTKCKIYIATA
jgi:predicted transcriptional regulator YdeE